MTAILGISALYHDSAACLVRDGRVVAAAQEERFSRRKHDSSMPARAVRYCLGEGGIGPERLDAVVFYEKPLLRFERLLETYLAFAPSGLRSFMRAMPQWLGEKLFVPRAIDECLGRGYEGPIYFTGHHLSHAASAFYPSPFDEAAILTMDGVGEWSTTAWGVGRGNGIRLEQDIGFPHSLGLLYSAFTFYTGFRVNSGEYKLMGLAPYGEPVFRDAILEHVVDLREDGSFRLDQRYFGYCDGLAMTSPRFHALFGGPPRPQGAQPGQREMDLAASGQAVVEEIVLRMARHVHARTGLPSLCLAGGVALNCVANGRIAREGPFEHVWIQPAAGDAGGALGAALEAWHGIMGRPRIPARPDGQSGSLLGPSYDLMTVRNDLDRLGARYAIIGDEDALADRVADLLGSGRVVGWFQGRMEYGPRALGARSILADPRDPGMQRRLNLKIKKRESFRPFAPVCLAERARGYFDPGSPSPYMLEVQGVRGFDAPDRGRFRGLDLLDEVRSPIPAVTHVDGSARLQTIDADGSPRLRRLLLAFEGKTGCPVLVNTSLNVRGEPIVRTPGEAYACFRSTDMDAIVIGDCLCLAEDQAGPEGARRDAPRFEPD